MDQGVNQAGGQLIENPYAPLPSEAMKLCAKVNAPPRLIAHLILVHDTARSLVTKLRAEFPSLDFDEHTVFFGAATHDLGKAIHREELSESGRQHELRGVELLKEHGVPEHLARFAYTHNNWKPSDAPQFEDLLVALADKTWKAKRIPELEAPMTTALAKRTGKPEWECYAILDNLLQDLSANSNANLEWQRSFPVS
jgi:putative nucleotidyltransferase with HDIG domain